MHSGNGAPGAGASVQGARFRTAVFVVAAIVALDALWRVSGFGGDWATKLWSDLIAIPVTAVAGALCWKTARSRSGGSRRAWAFLGAGVVSWGAGQCAWAFYELALGRDVPFPSLADAGFLLLIPFTAAALLSFPLASKTFTARTRVLLDGVMVATSTFALSWNLVLGPVYRAGSHGVFERSLGLAYPLGDLVLIGLVLFVGARAIGPHRWTAGLIACGVVAIAVSDSLFSYFTRNDTYSSTSVVGVGWTAGFLLIALAALMPASSTPSHEDTPTTKLAAVIPYLAIVVGVPVQVVKFARTGRFETVEFIAGIVLFIAVAIRQMVYALENRALAHNLEIKVQARTTELERALNQLREAARRQEEFVSHASHELFTPLTTLVGSLEMLANPETPPHNGPQLLGMAGQAAKRMTQLVDDLMLATGLSGFVPCERKPFDVPARIRLALAKFDVHDKTVETKVVEGLTALGDAERFQTALSYVLANADKFAPSGTTIAIEARRSEDDVVVTVNDEGAGVPAEFREIAFERFSQLDGSDTRRHDGLGLGLFLTRQLVRGMGGDVTIEDGGVGCLVRLSLPGAAGDPLRAEARVRAANSGIRRTYG